MTRDAWPTSSSVESCHSSLQCVQCGPVFNGVWVGSVHDAYPYLWLLLRWTTRRGKVCLYTPASVVLVTAVHVQMEYRLKIVLCITVL